MRFAAGIAAKQPFQVLVQVTNRCNMKCSFCDFWANGAPPSQELTVDEYRRIAGELSQAGTFLVSIEGGEPTVRPDLVEIVRAFGERHLPVLYTNGWFVDRELADALFAAGLHQVGVSIDFADPIRHDAKRGIAGAWERAWRAVETLREAGGARRVHVMSVLMEDNRRDLPRLLEQSAAAGVGHMLTLLSKNGYRRKDGVDDWPATGVAEELAALWRRHPHFRVFGEYLRRIDDFLGGGAMPTCHAGDQSFNIDHLGNVSACIETIDRPAGNVRNHDIATLLRRMRGSAEVARCQDCWTLCRGFSQVMGEGGSLSGWRDLATRLRA